MGEEEWRKPPGQRPRPRIESLSDVVFGLALSIGAIALVSNPPATSVGLYRDIATFTFNFIVLISIWLRYTRIMSVLPLETSATMMLNSVLLFTVTMEPFLFNILRSGNSAAPVSIPLFEAASSLYGIDLEAMMLIMGVFTLALASEEKRLVPEEMTRQLRFESTVWLASSGIFLFSALPLFGRTYVGGVEVTGFSLREVLWLLAVLTSWISTVFMRMSGPTTPRSGVDSASMVLAFRYKNSMCHAFSWSSEGTSPEPVKGQAIRG
jgi:uncharacterized membrane protein